MATNVLREPETSFLLPRKWRQ